MPDRIDRRIGGTSSLLITVAVLFALALGAGSYVWLHLAGQSPSPPIEHVPIQPLRYDEPLTVMIAVPGGSTLLNQPVPVKRQPDTQAQAREALNAALADPRSAQSSVLGQLSLRSFFLDTNGTAYVDFSSGAQAGIRGTAWDEFMAIYSVVDTLTQNFEEIKEVRFLLDGREVRTLAGHLDLSRAFSKRPDLVK